MLPEPARCKDAEERRRLHPNESLKMMRSPPHASDTPSGDALRHRLTGLLARWRADGMPGRATLLETAASLMEWRRSAAIPGLWRQPPVMVTATLDDGFGHGIDLIGRYALVCGVELHPVGLMAPVSRILEACGRHQAQILGLTVLRDDQEEALLQIRRDLSPGARLMAGGPATLFDPELAERVGIDVVARDLRDFLGFLLNYEGSAR